MDDREKVLGFKPQKEIIYNKLLPDSHLIDKESNEVFAEIKGNLGRSVQLRDIKFGAGHWVGQLSRYIRLYGLKFSKEDHLALVHLLYELCVMPDLEISLVQKFANQLIELLKKKELLSRDDLSLPWRPLYELVESILNSKYEHLGLQLFPSNIENTLISLVNSCRTYFPAESTQEMLDEWRPLLCPFDVTIMKGLSYLDRFLPTNLPEEQMDQGFRLWFKELMDMWDSFHNNPSWECHLVSLMGRLAHDNIGYIDWSPYISKIFNRLLRSFDLPVGGKNVNSNRNLNKGSTRETVDWIVSLMGGGSDVQDHIDKLFKTLQTFYHPSNIGRWNVKLSMLLIGFPKAVVRRLHRERYQKPRWWKPVPDSHKLTETDITLFVESMKNVVFTSMFSKYGSADASVAFKHLSTMRPEMMVPPLLEKLYPAMETLIEPHRLIACMSCIVSVARSMLSARKWYPEGPTHILPLLNLALPGIDPNDFKKCLVTFRMISTFVALVPIIDCSEAVQVRTDLTEDEKELCSATAQFEDFVLLFVDRIFVMIENSAQENIHGDQTKLNPEQMMMEIGLASSFASVLQQCSTPIFMSALRRLHNFVTTSVFESHVGGRFAANLVRAAAKVNPAATVKMFLKTFCDNIMEHIRSHEDVKKEEQLDDSFVWNLQMLSQLVRCNGRELLPYKEELFEVLGHVLQLKCVLGYDLAGQLLCYILRALTLDYILNFQSVAGSYDRPVSEHLAIRDWAKPGDLDNLGIEWHIPSEDEIQFATEIFERVLQPELTALQQISQESPMQREDLLRTLNTVLECLSGAGAVLPMWEGNNIQMIESQVPMKRFGCYEGARRVSEVCLGGGNVRLAVAKTIRPLLKYMLSSSEDDTKSLFRLIRIYETVLFFTGGSKTDFDARWKNFHIVKSALEDKMRGGKKHIRTLLVDRVQLQSELRQLNKTSRAFTAHHQELLEDLFTLSISRYSEVRKKAQAALFQNFHYYPYSYRAILPELVEKLKNSDMPEHQFQGALFVLLGNSKRNIAMKRSWEVISLVWPTIVQSQHSEKPTILKVIDDIVRKIVKNVESAAIEIKVNEAALTCVSRVLDSRTPLPNHQSASQEDLQAGVEYERKRNNQNHRLYEELVTNIVNLVRNGNLTWKFCQIGMELLMLLLRHDTPTPVCAVQLITDFCIHESLSIRKVALHSMSAIQKQQKRPHKKIKVDPYKIAGVDPSEPASVMRPGARPDNIWYKYNTERIPDTQEKWELLVVVEKTHWGYYCWPKFIESYAPHAEQPKLNRDSSELSEGELVVHSCYSNPEYVEKLVGFLSMEENKGKDKYSSKRMTLFKGLFRNYGSTFLPYFKPHIERLMADTSHDKHDSSQRCAMEILAGVLRGSKHWSYTETKELWDWAVPILGTSLNNLTVSTVEDWASFYTNVSESRDPMKMFWFFELLMENPLNGEGGSFGDASRLYMLQSALLQQEWRVTDLHHRLLKYIHQHLAHPYKNVRDRIGSCLSNVYMIDYKMFSSSASDGPNRQAFLEEVLPQLDRLKDIVLEEGQHQNGNGNSTSTVQVPSDLQIDGADTLSQALHALPAIPGMAAMSSGQGMSGLPQELMSVLQKAVEEKKDKETVMMELKAMREAMMKQTGDTETSPSMSVQAGVEAMDISGDSGDSEEKKTLVRLCKTVMKCVSSSITRTFSAAPAEIISLLPILCTLESESKDEELQIDCSSCLSNLSRALLQPDVIPVVMATIKTTVGLSSWHTRVAVLQYLQVMVFCNFFTMQKPEYQEHVRETVLHLICDDQLEVREVAAVTLSGLLHCGYMEMDKDMLTHFERLGATKLKKRKKLESIPTQNLIQRHAGVLGLSAYVQAYPYDVPEFMPQILMDLSEHVNDPQPIQATVKKSLSNFRRTHHDNWQDHKLMFTDDQLVVLTDLLVSPNYYA